MEDATMTVPTFSVQVVFLVLLVSRKLRAMLN